MWCLFQPVGDCCGSSSSAVKAGISAGEDDALVNVCVCVVVVVNAPRHLYPPVV